MSERAAFREIIGRLVDEVATPEEIRRLESELRTDAALRADYLRYLNVDAALAGGAAGWSESTLLVPAERPRRRAVLAAAAVLLATIAATFAWQVRNREPNLPNVVLRRMPPAAGAAPGVVTPYSSLMAAGSSSTLKAFI